MADTDDDRIAALRAAQNEQALMEAEVCLPRLQQIDALLQQAQAAIGQAEDLAIGTPLPPGNDSLKLLAARAIGNGSRVAFQVLAERLAAQISRYEATLAPPEAEEPSAPGDPVDLVED